MINIKLDEKHRVISDSRQYILEEKMITTTGKNKGEVYYKPLGYYRKVCGLLKAYKDMELRNSNCETMLELLELAKSTDKRIEKIMEGI